MLTDDRQGLVHHVVERPEVGGPVGVAQAPLEGEEAGEDLAKLALQSEAIVASHTAGFVKSVAYIPVLAGMGCSRWSGNETI